MSERGAQEADGSSGWRPRIFVFLTVSALWLLWSGPLTFHHPLLIGFWLLSALLVTWLCDRLALVTEETVPLDLTARTLGYVPWLSGQVVTSSLAVLRRSWLPGSDISPTTERIETTTRSDIGLVTYANSISLTPGTLSMEADSEGRTLVVHALTKRGIDELRGGEMDRRLRHVETPLVDRLQLGDTGDDGRSGDPGGAS